MHKIEKLQSTGFLMLKALLAGLFFGSVFAAAGGIVGCLIFVLAVWCGWLDGPGGGMAVFPLMLIPAVVCGFYGLNLGVSRTRSREVEEP